MSVLHEVKLMRCENVSTGNLPSDAQDAGGLDFLLACQTDFGQNQMPRVAADYVIVQLHKFKLRLFRLMQTKNKSRRLRAALHSAFVLGLIFALTGCRLVSDKTVDVTNNRAWWGELETNRLVRLKIDSLMYRGALCGDYVERDLGNYKRETIKIEAYKANPSRWPELTVVKQGTRLRCVKLVRHFSLENGEYGLWAEFLDGEFKGKIVGLFGVYGDPRTKGTLHLNTKFLEPVL